jgi:hypothetical protein
MSSLAYGALDLLNDVIGELAPKYRKKDEKIRTLAVLWGNAAEHADFDAAAMQDYPIWAAVSGTLAIYGPQAIKDVIAYAKEQQTADPTPDPTGPAAPSSTPNATTSAQ